MTTARKPKPERLTHEQAAAAVASETKRSAARTPLNIRTWPTTWPTQRGK